MSAPAFTNSAELLADAHVALDDFMSRHRSAAIPALVVAIVEWSVRHGGSDVLRNTLERAIALTHDADEILRRASQ